MASRQTANPGKRPATVDQLQAALDGLRARATQRDRDNLARFAIHAPRAFGVSMANMKVLAKQLGRCHELAAALWKTGWYEARMLATLVDEPERVTPAQMNQWCRDFDNWAICDTACFCLFDRTPHAWGKVREWCSKKKEFEKRAAFALLWSLTVHDKSAADDQFVAGLRLIEKAAADDRNFVKKAVNMALRAIGKRNAKLNGKAAQVAERLAASAHATTRWIGKDAMRELVSPKLQAKFKTQRKNIRHKI